MAEINVQTKRQGSSSWVWILIVLAVVAAAAYFLMRNNDAVKNEVNNATSYSLTMENLSNNQVLKYSLW